MTTDFSVVVCTRNRSERVNEVLDALARQSLREFQIVVVDQSDLPDAELERRASDDPRIRVIRDSGRGLSRARNVAWQATSSEWLVFLDDDCIPEPGWAEALQEEFASGADFVSGHVGEIGLPARPDAVPNATFPVTEPRTLSGRWVWPFRIGYGVCFAVRRSRVDRLRGWDERLGPGIPDFPASDDMDFNYRFLRDGGVARLTPAARSHHHQWRAADEIVSLYRGYMAAWVGLAIKHLRTGDRLGGAWLYSYGLGAIARTFASALRHRSRLRLQVGFGRVQGLLAGTRRALARTW